MSEVTADYVQHLRALVTEGAEALRAISPTASAERPARDKWSPREVIGHLIDSASNNHQRFLRAQFQEDLVFPGYDQDAWVVAQRYHASNWGDLVSLWRQFNGHLANVMEAVPESERLRPRERHNLDQIAWQVVPRHLPTTLDYFMRDYVGHLRHHLRQVLGSEWDASRASPNVAS